MFSTATASPVMASMGRRRSVAGVSERVRESGGRARRRGLGEACREAERQGKEGGYKDMVQIHNSRSDHEAVPRSLDSRGHTANSHTRLCVGTFNIHNARSNLSSFVDLFLMHSLNVVVLQECSDRAFREMSALLAPHGFAGAYSPAAYAGNCLFTSLPMTRSYRVTSGRRAVSGAEMRSAVVAELLLILPLSAPDDAERTGGTREKGFVEVKLSVAGMHLSHVHEKDRSEQLAKFMDQVMMPIHTSTWPLFSQLNQYQHHSLLQQVDTPCIVAGDLNALLRSDYSAEKWNHISTIRAR
jgi:endonuclease/exonuclease/phosphatase family metal-dependent hydrolase